MTDKDTSRLNNLLLQAKNSVPRHENELLIHEILVRTRDTGEQVVPFRSFRLSIAAACVLIVLNLGGIAYSRIWGNRAPATEANFLESVSLNIY